MPYTAKQKLQIHLRAKRKVGLVRQSDAADKYIFMQQCVSELMDQGEADDESSARDVCELLWEEGSDLGDFGD
jgi:hypothetical protein